MAWKGSNSYGGGGYGGGGSNYSAGGEKEAIFNQGQAITFRLDSLFRKIYEARLSDDLAFWKKLLDLVMSEYWAKLNKDEKNDVIDYRDRIEKTIYGWMSDQAKMQVKGRTEAKIQVPQSFFTFQKLLEEFELTLRIYADKHGLMMPDKAGLSGITLQ